MAISINRNVPAKHRTPKTDGGGGGGDVVMTETMLSISNPFKLTPVASAGGGSIGSIPAKSYYLAAFQRLSLLLIAQACGFPWVSGTDVIVNDDFVPLKFGVGRIGWVWCDRTKPIVVSDSMVRIERAYDTHYGGTKDCWINLMFTLYNTSDSALTVNSTNLDVSNLQIPVWRTDGQPFAHNQSSSTSPDTRFARLEDLSNEW